MPPKPKAKKGADEERKAAEEAEAAARAAEMARFEKEEAERRKREEEERQREEEAKIRAKADAERLRVEIEQRLRQEGEGKRELQKEKERQQLQLLEEKETELKRLTEINIALNTKYQNVCRELHEETKESGRLAVELEAVKDATLEAEAMAGGKTKEAFYKAQTLQLELEYAQRQLVELEKKYNSVSKEKMDIEEKAGAEITKLQNEIADIKHAEQTDVAENMMLVTLLRSELDQYKHGLQQTQNQLEQRREEESRNTVLMGILSSTLDQHMAENKELTDTTHTLKKRVEELETTHTQASVKLEAAQEFSVKSQQENKARIAELETLGHVLKNELTEALDINHRLDVDLKNAKVQIEAYQTSKETGDTALFEQKIILKSELELLKSKSANDAQMWAKEKKNSEEEIARLTKELKELKEWADVTTEKGHHTHKEAFETNTKLAYDLESAKRKIQELESNAESLSAKWATERTELITETELAKSLQEQDKELLKLKELAMEKERIELLAQIETDKELAKTQEALMDKRAEQFHEKILAMSSELEQMKIKLETQQQEMAALEEAKINVEDDLRDEIDNLKKSHKTEQEALQTKFDALDRNFKKTQTEKTASDEALAKLQEELHEASTKAEELLTAHQAQDASRQTEIDGYKAVIAKLEASIEENFNFKILADQNRLLKSDVEAYRTQLKKLKAENAELSKEADFTTNHRSKSLVEKISDLEQHVEVLGKDHQMIAPLMQELIRTLQKHGLARPLQVDIDAFKATQLFNSFAAKKRPNSRPESPLDLRPHTVGNTSYGKLAPLEATQLNATQLNATQLNVTSGTAAPHPGRPWTGYTAGLVPSPLPTPKIDTGRSAW